MQFFLFIVALVAFAVTVVALLVAFKSQYDKGKPALVAVIALVVGGLLLFSSMANKVPQRNVGIVTEFGKATGDTTGPGLHFLDPWKNIENWDATRQSYDHRNERSCVQVRIADMSNACVEALVEWNTRSGKASEQWASYKGDFDNFVNRRVDPNFAMAFNEAFADHDPLKNVDQKTGNLNTPLEPYMALVKDKIEERIGSDVEVLAVVISRINYDDKTQNSIDAYRQAILKGRVLEKEQQNALLAKTVTETNAKVDKQTRCLELAKELNKEPGYCMWSNGFPAAAK